jgi:hypothetical protein
MGFAESEARESVEPGAETASATKGQRAEEGRRDYSKRDSSQRQQPPWHRNLAPARAVETGSDANPTDSHPSHPTHPTKTVAFGAGRTYAANRLQSLKWKFRVILTYWVEGRKPTTYTKQHNIRQRVNGIIVALNEKIESRS